MDAFLRGQLCISNADLIPSHLGPLSATQALMCKKLAASASLEDKINQHFASIYENDEADPVVEKPASAPKQVESPPPPPVTAVPENQTIPEEFPPSTWSENLTCGICGKTMGSYVNLLRHTRLHRSRIFKCFHCAFEAARESSLYQHVKNVHKTRTRGMKKGSLHLEDCVQKPPCSCNVCGATFCRWDQLSLHEVTHKSITPFICEHCSKPFSRESFLVSHSKWAHRPSAMGTAKKRKRRKRTQLPQQPSPKLAEEQTYEEQTNVADAPVPVPSTSFTYVEVPRKSIIQSSGSSSSFLPDDDEDLPKDQTEETDPLGLILSEAQGDDMTIKEEVSMPADENIDILYPEVRVKAEGGCQNFEPSASPCRNQDVQSDQEESSSTNNDVEQDIPEMRMSVGEVGQNPEEYRCTHCNKVVLGYGQFCKHMRIHITEKKYSCGYCSYAAVNKKLLYSHFTGCHVDKLEMDSSNNSLLPARNSSCVTYICTVCEMHLKRWNDMSLHELSHKTIVPVKCHLCLTLCSRKEFLEVHIKKCHKHQSVLARFPVAKAEPAQAPTKGPISTKFSCDKCSRNFLFQSMYNAHMKEHESEERAAAPPKDSSAGSDDDDDIILLEDDETPAAPGSNTESITGFNSTAPAAASPAPSSVPKESSSVKVNPEDEDIVIVEGIPKCSTPASSIVPAGMSSIAVKIPDVEARKRFKCPYCDHTDVRMMSLNKHIYAYHKKAVKRMYLRGIQNVIARSSMNTSLANANLQEEHSVVQVQRAIPAAVPVASKDTEAGVPAVQGAAVAETEDVVFKCEYDEDYNPHSEVQTSSKRAKRPLRYQCKVCWKSFRGLYNLQRHMNVHVYAATVAIKCKFCPQSFRYKATHDRHVRVYHSSVKERLQTNSTTLEDGAFKCSLCPKTFSSWIGMTYHRVAHKHKPQCPSCFRTFNRTKGLLRHMEMFHPINLSADDPPSAETSKSSHELGPKVTCPLCTWEFKNEAQARAHINRMHAETKNLLPICDVCGRIYGKNLDLLQHLQAVHSKLAYCFKCHRSFGTERECQEHFRQARACQICDLSFDSVCSWNQHSKVHLSEP